MICSEAMEIAHLADGQRDPYWATSVLQLLILIAGAAAEQEDKIPPMFHGILINSCSDGAAEDHSSLID